MTDYDTEKANPPEPPTMKCGDECGTWHRCPCECSAGWGWCTEDGDYRQEGDTCF